MSLRLGIQVFLMEIFFLYSFTLEAPTVLQMK